MRLSTGFKIQGTFQTSPRQLSITMINRASDVSHLETLYKDITKLHFCQHIFDVLPVTGDEARLLEKNHCRRSPSAGATPLGHIYTTGGEHLDLVIWVVRDIDAAAGFYGNA